MPVERYLCFPVYVILTSTVAFFAVVAFFLRSYTTANVGIFIVGNTFFEISNKVVIKNSQ